MRDFFVTVCSSRSLEKDEKNLVFTPQNHWWKRINLNSLSPSYLKSQNNFRNLDATLQSKRTSVCNCPNVHKIKKKNSRVSFCRSRTYFYRFQLNCFIGAHRWLALGIFCWTKLLSSICFFRDANVIRTGVRRWKKRKKCKFWLHYVSVHGCCLILIRIGFI